MAYKYEPNTYTMTFDEKHRFHGLTMKVRSVKLGDFTKVIAMAGMAEKAMDESASDALKAEALEAMDSLFNAFSKALVSWDMEDEDGTPIPASREGLDMLDFEFVLPLVQEWMQAIGGVSQELGKGFSSGGTSPAPAIPLPEMAAL